MHADAIARLQSTCDAATSTERALHSAKQALEQDMRAVCEQLHACQQETTRLRAEAQTIQAVLERITPLATAKVARQAKAAR